VKILSLDTATEGCSAALWIDGDIIHRGAEFERGHGERILPMIDELLGAAGLTLSGLDAIAFGRGPGSFTGVRLAASVTQGLAFGADLPVVPISDLQAVAQRALRLGTGATRTVVCNDARMSEVYWACFETSAEGLMSPVGRERVGKPATVTLPESWEAGQVSMLPWATADVTTVGRAALGGPAPRAAVHGAGRGFAAYPELRDRLSERLTSIDDRALPDATDIAVLAAAQLTAGRTVAAEAALPVYLRDDVARPKS
jgi:tRNA threonylcarbamoyladenosine biosynthesis protein TsaB